jgi:hypothetical protein
LAQWRSPPFLPLTAIVTLIFRFSAVGKVDKLIPARHLQALECLLHSQHVFAHQFTSQGVQHFLWAWQSLSPSNIFRPCRRAYERCMRRIYGTWKKL